MLHIDGFSLLVGLDGHALLRSINGLADLEEVLAQYAENLKRKRWI